MPLPLKRGELFEKATNVPQAIEGRPGVVVVRVGDRVVVRVCAPEDMPENTPG